MFRGSRGAGRPTGPAGAASGYAARATDICHAANGNSFIVRSDGRLSKCAVALSSPDNYVGRLLEDGRVKIDERKANLWMRGLWSEDKTELACPLIGIDSKSEPLVELRAQSG